MTEHIEEGRAVSRTIQVGVARLPDCAGKTSTLTTSSAIGVGLESRGFKLGYMRGSYACIPEECKAVFWAETSQVAAQISEVVGENNQFCVFESRAEG